MIAQLLSDVRQGARMLRRSPGLAALAIVTLALGIGATTTMFSITNGILRDLPVDRPERLMHVARVDRTLGRGDMRIGAGDIAAARESQRSFEGIAAYEQREFHLGDATRRAARYSGARITANALQLLRVRPALGRAFQPADEVPGAEPVVILGHSVWRDRYDADPATIGRTIRVNGVAATVVGVMPEGFRFPAQHDLWAPLAMAPRSGAAMQDEAEYDAFGRLRDGVSREQAAAEMASIARRLDLAAPKADGARGLGVRPYHEHMVPRDARMIFRAMLIVVSFVLLIACANVANLLRARAIDRAREVAVRVALGAGRARIVTQLLVESLIVATLGGVLGLGFAWAGVTAFSARLGFELSFWMDVRLDGEALAFVTALVALAALAAGLAPARQASRVDVNDVLRDQTRGSSSFRIGRVSAALVGGEVALSCALLVITGLMVKGVVRTVERNPGLSPEQVVTARIELRDDAYPDTASVARYIESLQMAMAARPGTAAAAVATEMPGFDPPAMPVEVDGVAYDRPESRPRAGLVWVSPGFFATFGAAFLQGRDFAWSDGAGAEPVAIVNRSFATRHLDGRGAIGKRVRVRGVDGEMSAWATVVGVVPDFGTAVTGQSRLEGIYLPLAQGDARFVAIAVRTIGDAHAMIPDLRRTVASLDADVPLFGEGRLDEQLVQATAGERLFGALFALFGLAALALAAVGLYGVMSFSVRRRSRELGIRAALGGQPRDILWPVMRGSAIQLGAGVGIGLAIALVVAPQFGDALFGSNAHDWTVYGVVGLALIMTGGIAGLVPARRALAVDPADVLRRE